MHQIEPTATPDHNQTVCSSDGVLAILEEWSEDPYSTVPKWMYAKDVHPVIPLVSWTCWKWIGKDFDLDSWMKLLCDAVQSEQSLLSISPHIVLARTLKPHLGKVLGVLDGFEGKLDELEAEFGLGRVYRRCRGHVAFIHRACEFLQGLELALLSGELK